MKQILIILMIVMFIGMASAENIQSLNSVKQGNSIILKQNCINSTYVNITSISITGITNLELLNSSISMNQISNGYQTYNFTNTLINGYYIVTGICDENGIVKAWSYDFNVTPTGNVISTVEISIYIFFFLVCLIITFFSFRLTKSNGITKDVLKGKDAYELKKRNELLFYVNVLKQKLWIAGIFGIYFSLLIFNILLYQLVYNLGLDDLHNFLRYSSLILLWGSVPLVLFFLAYLILVFANSTKEALKWQFGNIGGRKL